MTPPGSTAKKEDFSLRRISHAKLMCRFIHASAFFRLISLSAVFTLLIASCPAAATGAAREDRLPTASAKNGFRKLSMLRGQANAQGKGSAQLQVESNQKVLT